MTKRNTAKTVKCKICGKEIEKETAYIVQKNTQKLYYCNKEEYEHRQKETLMKDKAYEIICRIFSRKVINSKLFTELNDIHQLYSYEIIFHYLEENEEYITKAMNKDFSSEYAEIRYFTAIIKNNLNDFNKMQITKHNDEKIKKEYSADPVIKGKKKISKRRGFAEQEAQFNSDCV